MIRRLILLLAAAGFALSSGDVGSAAESTCQLVRIAELPVRIVKNKLIVDGAINGEKIGIALDTGAAVTLMLRQAADRLKLERRDARGYRIFGIGGETKAESVLIDDFRIGQASRRGWRMLVAGDRDFGEEFAVFLGEDFFSQVDVEFDLAHNALRLFQPKNCGGVSLAYWTTEEPREVAIEPIYDYVPRILLTVQINGRPVKAMLDSGASGSMLASADASRLGVTPETPGVVAGQRGYGIGPKQIDSWLAPFDSFIIGDEIINHPHIWFGDLFKDETYTPTGSRVARQVRNEQPMILGADFLRAHRVLISHSQRKMYFTYLGGPVFAVPRPPSPGANPIPNQDSPKGSEK